MSCPACRGPVVGVSSELTRVGRRVEHVHCSLTLVCLRCAFISEIDPESGAVLDLVTRFTASPLGVPHVARYADSLLRGRES